MCLYIYICIKICNVYQLATHGYVDRLRSATHRIYVTLAPYYANFINTRLEMFMKTRLFNVSLQSYRKAPDAQSEEKKILHTHTSGYIVDVGTK